MARHPAASFRLPQGTLDQIKALQVDLDSSATDIIIIAVDQLYQREIGPLTERNVYAELDELKRRLDELTK